MSWTVLRGRCAAVTFLLSSACGVDPGWPTAAADYDRTALQSRLTGYPLVELRCEEYPCVGVFAGGAEDLMLRLERDPAFVDRVPMGLHQVAQRCGDVQVDHALVPLGNVPLTERESAALKARMVAYSPPPPGCR